MTVLVVEDHPDIRLALEIELRDEGYQVDSCDDGHDAQHKMMQNSYDAIILDILLPGVDGIHLLKKLRDAGKSTPVIMLTSQSSCDTKVASLNIGADDYLTKPFEYSELSARLRALLRRSTQTSSDQIQVGSITLFPNDSRVLVNGEEVSFTRQEFTLVAALVNNKGQAVSREFIYDRLAECEANISPNLLDVLVCKARKKLGKESIKTVRGVGYSIGL